MTEAAADLASPSEPSRTCPAACGQPALLAFDLRCHHVLQCPICGLYMLALSPDHAGTLLDRTQVLDALEGLRVSNYQHILQRLAEPVSVQGRRLLDVGCSGGLFLGLASDAGYEGHGIEPDAFFYARAKQALPPRVPVVHGHFPSELPREWGRFDVITFHDVFEHLPDPVTVLQAVRDRLTADGVVVLSLPMADGFVFAVARLLYRCGFTGPLERMFQVHYPYPHLFYFARRSIAALAQRAGFETVLMERLRSFSARGSLHRARFDRAQGSIGRAKQYAGALALIGFALLERVLPADNGWVILRPRSA